MKRILAFVICVLALTFGSLLRRGWVEMSAVDPEWDPVRTGAVYGWGWPLEFIADNPHPFENRRLGSEDLFRLKPFLFDLMTFSVLVGVAVLIPAAFRRLRA